MNELTVKNVEFMGGTLIAAQDKDGIIWAGVKWICNGIGMNKNQADRQIKNIQTDMVIKEGCVKFDAGVFDLNNETIALQLDYIPLWLAKISITPNMKNNSPELVDKLVKYQLQAKDVLAKAFLPINSDEQLKAKLLLSIYNGGQEGVLASKELTDMEVKAATTPLLETIDQQNETISEQDKQLKLQAPFVQAALDLQRTKNTLDMNQSAKALRTDGIEIGRNTLFSLLRDKEVLMKDNTPYQKYINAGLFKVVVVVKENHWGFKSIPTTRVTGKGLIFLNKKLREWMELEPLDIDIDEVVI